MTWIILAALLVAACGVTGDPRSADRTTCAEWLDRMNVDERASMAGAVLDALWHDSGATAAPGADVVDAFVDGIGSVCRADPSATVAWTGSRVYDALPDVRPAGLGDSSSPEPSDGSLSTPEEPLTITIDGRQRADVVMSELELTNSFGGADGDAVAHPEHVFLQLHVRYRSLVDGFGYGPADWRPIVDGVPRRGALATLESRPEPWLSTGILDAGEEAGGYLVFEVPGGGEVVLSYTGVGEADPPIDVVLRDAPRKF